MVLSIFAISTTGFSTFSCAVWRATATYFRPGDVGRALTWQIKDHRGGIVYQLFAGVGSTSSFR